ncbi:MAG: VWA domain-containing protein [Gammaproteobacteria bacterium]|nr:VWA domain-containing protein [Gammaproteobacteria bacterium]
MIEQFHFIRPSWLLALLPLLLLTWLLLRKKLFSRSWQSVIDPALLPHLLIGKPGKNSRLPVMLFFIGGILAVIALAGPAWEKRPQPVFKKQSALVIALDLSLSMDATDIKPSRLARARHKISDILKFRKEGQTALIGYAGEAFTISPLTDDAATINSLVPSLSTELMPAQGSNISKALNRASELLKNAGISKGDILLITDDVDDADSTIDELTSQGHRLSILAIGTPDGAPIPSGNGGFVKNASGAIVIPKLDAAKLKAIASSGDGRFSRLTASDKDIKHILGLLVASHTKKDSTETEMKTDVWREQGPWLLLLLMPLAAFAFRKGYLSLAFILLIPFPQPADALSWDELWRNDNQRASEQFAAGNNAEAAELFKQPEWKASAFYKAGEFEQSIEQLTDIDTADAHYNRGNALARMGRAGEAIDAYNQALQLDNNHEDAKFNRELLEKQQQEKQQNNQQNNEQSKDQKNSEQQSQDKSEQQDSSQQQQKKDQQSAENQSTEEQQAENESSQQQQNQTEEQQQKTQPEEEQQASTESSQQDLSKQEQQQWLKKIPNDPGGLLRNKFLYQYNRQGHQSDANQPW